MKKVKVQKPLMSGSLKETFVKFKDSFLEMKIGLSKFASFQPKEYKLAQASDKNSVCVCTIHNDVMPTMTRSMMSTMTTHLDVPMEHYVHGIARITYNPPQPLCNLRDCNYCPDAKNLRVQLAQCFQEAEIETLNSSNGQQQIDQIWKPRCSKLTNIYIYIYYAPLRKFG